MNRSTRTNVRLAFWTLALAVLLAVWGNWSAALRAQEDAPAAESPSGGSNDAAAADAAEKDAAEGNEKEAGDDSGQESLGEVIWKSIVGNWFGLPFYILLAVFSVAAVMVVLERLLNLRRATVLPPKFMLGLRELLGRKEDSMANFRRLCEGSRSPAANVLKAGVFRSGRPLPEVEKAMEDAIARETAAMRSRHRPLSVIGSVAPLVGLLGTVVGMIVAFRTASEEGMGKAELLAEGIYLALLTTAAGLTIAIPCLLFTAWFNTLVERFMRDIDETLLETMPSFARVENGGVAGSTVPEPKLAAAGKA